MNSELDRMMQQMDSFEGESDYGMEDVADAEESEERHDSLPAQLKKIPRTT